MKKLSFLQTTIGRKVLMAITGVLFCFFLLVHLLNNLTLFVSPDTFNSLVSSLEYIKPLIRVLEALLLLILVVHISNAIILSIRSRKARPTKYRVKPKDSSSFASRSMILSGTVILLFLIIHLGTFWKTFQTFHGNSSYYDIVVNNKIIGFGNPLIVILYISATIFIGLHLKHGFESAIQTLGINNPRARNILNKVSVLFWFVVPFGFCFIAIWFGIIKKIF